MLLTACATAAATDTAPRPRAKLQCGVQDGTFLHGSRSGNRIALTFDACPTTQLPSFAPEVVDYLEADRVPTTFFISGSWAQANPDALRRIARVPFFEIALHGHDHPRLADASAEGIRKEIEDGRSALLRLGAKPAPLFRPPFWDRPQALASAARASGVLAVIGDVGLGDPSPTRSAEVMERDAVRWVQGGSVLLLHVNGRGFATAQTVRDLVPLFRARGYVFSTASELLDECGDAAAVEDLRSDTTASDFAGVWSWGEPWRSAEVPFLRISGKGADLTVETKHYMHGHFVSRSRDIQASANRLSFAYWYEPLQRWAQCSFELGQDRMWGHCDGEQSARQWGALPAYLWRSN